MKTKIKLKIQYNNNKIKNDFRKDLTIINKKSKGGGENKKNKIKLKMITKKKKNKKMIHSKFRRKQIIEGKTI